jgi:hypothetical protein
MSYLGAIGYVMDGSGLQDVFNTAYAHASTEKMLAGHAYARAVRAHTLCNLALGQIILTRMGVSEDESIAPLESIERTFLDPSYYTESSIILENLMQRFANYLEQLELNGPTAKLWVQYFHMTTLMKQFIQAERSGDWKLHINSVKKMLPYFHASGHFLYAKSAHLYVQDMLGLERKISKIDYERFVLNGWLVHY